MKTAIAAFRYKPISEDIMHYLCDMNEAPFSSSSDENFDNAHFQAAFVKAMENHVLETLEVKSPVNEYFISHGGFDPVNVHIVRAFGALICFLTGHGFRNENGCESCKQIRDMLTMSDQLVNLSQWNLKKADLQEANLFEADLQGANLRGANLQEANLQEANLQEANLQGSRYCTHPVMRTTFPDGFDPKKHGMIEVNEDGIPVA